jgi:hypothetical protein
MSRAKLRVSAARVLNAGADAAYAILADDHEGHAVSCRGTTEWTASGLPALAERLLAGPALRRVLGAELDNLADYLSAVPH